MWHKISKLYTRSLKENFIRIRNLFGKRIYKDKKMKQINPDRIGGGFFGDSDLGEMFRTKSGNSVSKWHHYFDIYETYFNRFRGESVKILEIGVSRGGSLELWREYFGDKATIFGIDVDPSCSKFDGVAGSVRIGSQDDRDFLKSVVGEMGGVDIVIDDGSHDSLHIKEAFDFLFPVLSDGGIYIAEDLHCCYWPKYSGGYWWPWSFINVSKSMVDDIHYRYHYNRVRNAIVKDSLKAIHFYDSMVVFEKMIKRTPPVATRRPVQSDADPG